MKQNKKDIPCKDGNVTTSYDPVPAIFNGIRFRGSADTKAVAIARVRAFTEAACRRVVETTERAAVQTIERKNEELKEKDEQIERLKRAVRHIADQQAEHIITAVCDPSQNRYAEQYQAAIKELEAPRNEKGLLRA